MVYIHPKAHDYQARALRFSLQHPESYQALDMGLGKTLIALMWAKNLGVPVLVVAPIKPMYNTWPDEIKKWIPDLQYTIIHGPDKARQLRKKADVYLTNFESILWLEKELKKIFSETKRLPFRAVVIDEGSMIKSSKTKRFKALKRLRAIFPQGKMILSATPSPNSLLELWSQYFFLDGGKRLGAFVTKFQVTHFRPVDQRGFIWQIKPGAEEAIYEAIAGITFRLNADDHIKLPKRIDNFIKLSLPTKVQEKYEQLEADFFMELSSGQGLDIFNSASLSMKLRQFVQGAIYIDAERNYERIHYEKRDALKELVETSPKPILCAIQFRFEFDLIREVFPKVPIIYGGVSNKEAMRLVQAWNKGELPLLLCHPKSISHGMNLQAGSNIILWYGIPWSGEQYSQLIGRLARQGQKEENVIVHHFIMKKTIDVAIMASQKNKAKGQKGLLDYLYKYHRGEIND